MGRHEVRYAFEHQILPHLFYKDKEQFVGMVLQDKGVLYEIISSIFDKEGVENPYVDEDFEVEPIRLSEDVLMLKITLPEPEEEPLCYSIIMIFDLDFKIIKFYCIEKGNEQGSFQPFVCAWTEDERHLNYGHCGLDDNSGITKCVEIFAEEYREWSIQMEGLLDVIKVAKKSSGCRVEKEGEFYSLIAEELNVIQSFIGAVEVEGHRVFIQEWPEIIENTLLYKTLVKIRHKDTLSLEEQDEYTVIVDYDRE